MKPPMACRFSLVLLILILTGCGDQAEVSLRLAHHNWPGYEALSLAETRGLYKNFHIKTYRPSNNTGTILAFENNVVDVAAVTLSESIEIQSRSNEPVVIIAVLDVSHGGDVIIAGKDIKSVHDLKGKRLGMEPTALGAFFVSRALDSSPGFSLNQLNIVPVNVDHHLESFLTNKVDAVATYEPAKSQILKEKGHIIFDSTKIPNEIFDVLITKDSYAKNNPRALTELLNGYFRALDVLKTEPESAIAEMAEFEKIEADQYEKSLVGIHIPDRDENLKLLKGAEPQLAVILEKLSKFLKEKNIIDKKDNVLPKISSRFLLSIDAQKI